NLHCRAECPAVKLRAEARNEIRHYRDGLNPVITGLNCPASAGQCFIPAKSSFGGERGGAGSRGVDNAVKREILVSHVGAQLACNFWIEVYVFMV
ncbi:MAG: hypothetical protein IKW48_03915, partial [Akkermansia sp.]|nr:hypothetical protein [Akkermansia sp.]